MSSGNSMCAAPAKQILKTSLQSSISSDCAPHQRQILGLPKASCRYLPKEHGVCARDIGHVSCLPLGTCETGIRATGLKAGVRLTSCVPGSKSWKNACIHTCRHTLCGVTSEAWLSSMGSQARMNPQNTSGCDISQAMLLCCLSLYAH